MLVFTLGTDRLIPLFDLSEWDGSDAATMEIQMQNDILPLSCSQLISNLFIYLFYFNILLGSRSKPASTELKTGFVVMQPGKVQWVQTRKVQCLEDGIRGRAE